MGTSATADGARLDGLPVELVAAITRHLGDRDLCRARAAHRCFHADSAEALARRACRWRGKTTPEEFCAVGLVEALEILHARGVPMGRECAREAALAGHVDVLDFLRRNGLPLGGFDNPDLVTLLAMFTEGTHRNGFAPGLGEAVGQVIRRMATEPSAGGRHDAPPMSVSLVDVAARNGHLQAVAWLVRVASVVATSRAMDLAAARGHGHVVRWLHQHVGDHGCTTAAMDLAAINGHLDIVVFLHENRTEGCTTAAMDGAAAAGRADVVVFLHERRREGCTVDAVGSAAAGGHTDVVRFLCENRSEGFTRDAIREAEWNGCARIAAYLARRAGPDDGRAHIRGPFAPHPDDDDAEGDKENRHAAPGASPHLWAAFMEAVFEGDIAATDAIHAQGIALGDPSPPIHRNPWMTAALLGRLDVIEWLAAHGAGGRDCDVIEVALLMKRLDVVRWLYDNGVRNVITGAIDDAAARGESDPVRAVYDRHALPISSAGDTMSMVDSVHRLAESAEAGHRPS
ncbi:Ankyrin repeat domain containing protein [Pandoravirus dulcis]|uniref:Ankyrin repeat domain containing protein n=1 Tax=Pandoravirus dulcis TaxID=1349409 RepID=S4VUE9_9VIRU|nr:Ankyrin repeat domain containing protein [Pandoravirus dulcis]AGO83020.2 Ankyrin repeat domain containing protein [Pandoravirus dulcis]